MIILNDRWAIDADAYQYILKEKTGVKDKQGEDIYRNISYHKTVDAALQQLADDYERELVAKEKLTIYEAISEFQIIEEKIANYFVNVSLIKKGYEPMEVKN